MQSFDVKGMECDHCAAAVTSAVQFVDPGATVQVDVAAGKVIVRDGAAPADVLLEAIASEGYDAVPSGD